MSNGPAQQADKSKDIHGEIAGKSKIVSENRITFTERIVMFTRENVHIAYRTLVLALFCFLALC